MASTPTNGVSVTDPTTGQAARDPRHAIRTFSGQLFWPLEAREDEIQLEDIAHALAHLCRFTGHSREFYSVAQHSVLVSRLCPPVDALWGLLHDASEAYLGDVSRPIKHHPLFGGYRAAEAALQALIARRFGLGGPEPESVRLADVKALHVELRDLVSNSAPVHGIASAGMPAVIAQKSTIAKYLFVERFHSLIKGGI